MSAIAAPVAGVPADAWSTPRRLRAFVIAFVVLALALFLVGEATLSRARSALKTIGRDSAPSIIAAEEISASLADLDANAANYLVGTRAHQQAASLLFEERRIRVTQRLVDAAENITYGDAEKAPILSLFENLGRYLEGIAQARLLKDRGDDHGALDAYIAASTLMHGQLLPRAEELDRANRRFMDDAYEAQQRASGGAELLAVASGGALAGVLVWAQIFLLRRMRRILNPALLAAMVLAVVFTALLVSRFGAAREALRAAKNDAFESIHLLWRARAVAYDANGDESRYLLDTQNAGAHQDAFKRHVGILTSRPELTTKADRELEGGKLVFSGLFADELGNITYPGERAAALEMVRAYSRYNAIDTHIRGLENAGQHAKAIELCIGSEANQSNAAFAKFDAALERVLAINKREFDATIEKADSALRSAEIVDPIIAIAIALLGFFGIRPRLAEYRG